MIKLKEKQKNIISAFQNNFDRLTYSQQSIFLRVQNKTHNILFQDWTEYEESYGSDYNDCHGDYYDAQ